MPPKKSKNGSKADGMVNPVLKNFIKKHEFNRTNNNEAVGQYFSSRMSRPQLLSLLGKFPAGRELLKKPNKVNINVKKPDAFNVFNKPNVNSNNNQKLPGLDENEFVNNQKPANKGWTSLYKTLEKDPKSVAVPLYLRKDAAAVKKFRKLNVRPAYNVNWRNSAKKRKVTKRLGKVDYIKFPTNFNIKTTRIPTRPRQVAPPSSGPRKRVKIDKLTGNMERLTIPNKTRPIRKRQLTKPRSIPKGQLTKLFGNSNSNSNSKSSSSSRSNSSSNSNFRKLENSNNNNNQNNSGYMSNMSNSLVNTVVGKRKRNVVRTRN